MFIIIIILKMKLLSTTIHETTQTHYKIKFLNIITMLKRYNEVHSFVKKPPPQLSLRAAGYDSFSRNRYRRIHQLVSYNKICVLQLF